MRFPRLSLLLLCASLSAQTAQVNIYGSGCRDGQNQSVVPAIQVIGVPQLGASMTVRYLGPNGMPLFVDNVPALITGLARASVPVPQLTPDMSSSCTFLVVPDVALFVMPRSGLAYQTDVQYAVPNDPSALGVSIYHQWATFVIYNRGPSATLGYVMFSNGAHVRVGT